VREMSDRLVKMPKVFNVGHPTIKDLFKGEVEITEKVDGSQFRILLTKEGWDCGSKNVDGKEKLANMFDLAIKQAERIYNIYKEKFDGETIMLYAEYLRQPKHNTLNYKRTPKNNLYLFGAFVNGKLQTTEQLKELANTFEIDPPNVLYVGEVSTPNELLKYLDYDSYLGNEKVEGIVIKNYNQTYKDKYYFWAGFPLMGKLVREEFRERNEEQWKSEKAPILDKMVASVVTGARLNKVIQHLKEQGKFNYEKSDLKYIIPEFIKDIEEEEIEYLKEQVWKDFWENFKRRARSRIVKLYLNFLLRKQFEGEENEEVKS